MKRRDFLVIAMSIFAQVPIEALAASKKPTPKPTPKATPKSPKKSISPTLKPTPSATPKASIAPRPEELPLLRDGELINLARLTAPTSFYASVFKNGIEIPLLVSKPTERSVKIFTARCPHQGSILNLSKLGEFTCDRHGAHFSDSTGKVLGGPTISNLETYEVIEREGSIYILI